MIKPVIFYQISPLSPSAHLFEITLTLPPQAAGPILRLPAWIPGSYTLREFAKHIVQIQAFCDDQPVRIEKLDKATWHCPPCQGSLRVVYQVYAFDMSVRAAYLDQTRGFFNGSSVFLSVDGTEDYLCQLEILPPKGSAYDDWRVATSLSHLDAELYGFGHYQAQNYDELIDHPVEMSAFSVVSFNVSDVPHNMVLIGRQRVDVERLSQDLQGICAGHVALFGELPITERYVFLTVLVGHGYGGLEHRSSCTLMCERSDLPVLGQAVNKKDYHRFLGLCSHEYFHLWNVKRIKPQGFVPYNLRSETYTRQLWVFEGITSYYDDLNLLRSGSISSEDYLHLLEEVISRVWQTPGRFKQSLAESSFDTWIKLYDPNENTPNAQVSYYSKGALLALTLDLHIRHASQNTTSLDDVMRLAWHSYGKPLMGMPEGGMETLAEATSGLNLKAFFEHYVYGTEDLPLVSLLATVGVQCEFRAAKKKQPNTIDVMGIKLDPDEAVNAVVKHAFDAGAAQMAGMSGQDQIVAVDYVKATKANVNKLLKAHPVGEAVTIHVFRRDELLTFSVTLQSPPENTCYLSLAEHPSEAEQQAQTVWLQALQPPIAQDGSAHE